MKTKIYLITLLVCAGSLLHAQRQSSLLGDRTPTYRPNPVKPNERPPLVDRIPLLSHAKRDAILRSAAIEKLDSVVVDDREKIEFVYDEHGYSSMATIYFKFSAIDDWTPFIRYEYVFTPDGHLLEELNFWWSEDLNDWEPQYREVNTYNPNGYLNDNISYYWNEISMDWDIDSRTLYNYLPDNRLDQEDYQAWNPSTQMWITYSRGNYHYDPMERLEEKIYSWYDEFGSVWEPFSRKLYTYNPDNLVERLSSYEWNFQDEDWTPRERIDYEYNTQGLRILETSYWYDLWDMVWTPDTRETQDYDTYGNLISTTFNYYDHDQGVFIPEDRRDIEYDVNTPIGDIYFPHIWDGEFIFNHKMQRITIYGYINDMWIEDFHGDFYYSPIITSVSSVRELAMRVYPNPASDHLSVQLPPAMIGGEVTLLHVSGQPVLQQVIGGTPAVIPVSHIPAGMYVLQYRSAQHGLKSQPLLIHR